MRERTLKIIYNIFDKGTYLGALSIILFVILTMSLGFSAILNSAWGTEIISESTEIFILKLAFKDLTLGLPIFIISLIITWIIKFYNTHFL